MLNVEKLLLLTVAQQDRLHGVDDLVKQAHVAAALADLEDEGVIEFAPADLSKPWDMTDPVIHVVPEKFPKHPGLNEMFKKLSKVHNKTVSKALKKAHDPRKGLLNFLAADGVLVPAETLTGFDLVSVTTAEKVADRLGLVLRSQTRAKDSEKMLLGIIDLINATKVMLGHQSPEQSPQQLSKRVNEVPSTHPVVSALHRNTDSTGMMMKKSQLASA